jgi:hypothetical protein
VTHAARRLLDQRPGLHVEVQLDTGKTRAKLVERHDAGVSDAFGDFPLDALVRTLLGDLGRELLRDPPDLRLELDVRFVVLGNALEAVHEVRPFLELRPLVVDGADRDADVDVLLDRHAPALADARHALLLAAATGQQALGAFLRNAGSAAGLVDLLVDLVADRALHLAADLVAGLLHEATTVATDAAHELAGTLRGQRHQCCSGDAGGDALGA